MFLFPEVVTRQAQRYAGDVCNVANQHRVVAELGEKLLRAQQDVLLSVLLDRFQDWSRHGEI